MLPSTVRRVVAAAPQAQAVSSLASSIPRGTTATLTIPQHSHSQQRRCSSSKPSSKDNGAKDIPAGQSVTASSQSRADKRKRKAKEPQFPSVPSTSHVSQEAFAESAFFSLHRPISVTHSFPKNVTDEAFASIFSSRTRSNKVSDVISTLSRTVDELEQPMAKMSIGGQQDASGGQAGGVRKIDLKNPDGTESSVYVQLNTMSGHYLPFTPPPLPRPQSAAEAAGAGAADAAVEEAASEEPHHRVYKAVFTIEETTEPDGQVKIMAHSGQLIEEGERTPRTFLERMALRQFKFDEAQQTRRNEASNDMHAISVKRQRKLKMKKKKYKKLMKRTRNLRRKLDRT